LCVCCFILVINEISNNEAVVSTITNAEVGVFKTGKLKLNGVEKIDAPLAIYLFNFC